MNDTMQFFTNNYRPLIRQADQLDPHNLQEVIKKAVPRPFVFGGRPSSDMQSKYAQQQLQTQLKATQLLQRAESNEQSNRPVTYSYSMNDPYRGANRPDYPEFSQRDYEKDFGQQNNM